MNRHDLESLRKVHDSLRGALAQIAALRSGAAFMPGRIAVHVPGRIAASLHHADETLTGIPAGRDAQTLVREAIRAHRRGVNSTVVSHVTTARDIVAGLIAA